MENQSLMTEYLREGERLDDLQRDSLMIIQNPSWFCFGMDAVLLSAFTKATKGDRILDLCTGNAVIPLLLSARTQAAHIDGIEIQKDIADMASRSVRYNGLEDRIEIRQADIKDAVDIYNAASFDVVTCNPPYLKEDGGLINPTDHKAIARHELLLTLSDVIKEGARLLVSGGHFFMVHRPFRLAEIISEMVSQSLEPKRMRLVYPYADKEPNMVLIEGVRGGNSGIVVEKPLVIYSDDGTYTDEVRELYEN